MNSLALLALLLAAGGAAGSDDGRACCYYPTWPYAYNGMGQFTVNNIDATLCSHIIYSFIGLEEDGKVMLLDAGFDKDQDGLNNFVSTTKAGNAIPMVAVGGWNLQSTNFSIVAANSTKRATFISSVIDFLEEYGFQGLDLDWEYPNNSVGSSTDDYTNFVTWCQELKAAFSEKGYLLSAAVAPTQYSIGLSYNVTALNEILDFINIMMYDFHGTWDGVTGANAPLYPQPTDSSTLLSVNASVYAWINSGASPAKINLGLATYGHAYTLADVTNNGTGAAITDAAYTAPYTGETSTWNYIEICSDQTNNTDAWTVVNYEDSYVYAVKESLWIGYDDVDTISAKAAFAKELGLGGYFFWALHGDDFQGYCGGGKWPLLTAARSAFSGSSRR